MHSNTFIQLYMYIHIYKLCIYVYIYIYVYYPVSPSHAPSGYDLIPGIRCGLLQHLALCCVASASRCSYSDLQRVAMCGSVLHLLSVIRV